MSYGDDSRARRLYSDFTTTEVSATVFSDSRLKSDTIIDGYMKKIYPGSFPYTGSAPALINSISDDLTVYFCLRSKKKGLPGAVSGDIKETYYDPSIKMLEDIQAGKIRIPEIAKKSVIESNTRQQTPVAGLEAEESWEVSPNRLDEESNKE